MALGAGVGLDDAKVDTMVMDPKSFADANDARSLADERASRGDRELSVSIAEAPEAWVLPLHNYDLTSKYGPRWGRMHQGVDLAMPEGTPIVAMHAGVVVHAGWNGGYGYMVMIDHGNGVKTLYGHNSRLQVKLGQRVAAGDPIALLGNTGHSTGPHLHLEVHINDVRVDPVPWFKQRGVDLNMEIESIDGTVID